MSGNEKKSMDSLYYLCCLLAFQVKPGGGGSESAASGGAPAASSGSEGSGGFGDFSLIWLMLAVMMMIFLFVMPKQQQKDQAKLDEMLDNLKKNDEVVTAGGIVGTVVNLRDGEYITIRIDENNNTRMKILKKSIIRVLTGDKKKND